MRSRSAWPCGPATSPTAWPKRSSSAKELVAVPGRSRLKDRFPLTLDRPRDDAVAACIQLLGLAVPEYDSEEQMRTEVVAASVFGTTAVELNRRPVIETILNPDKLDDCRPRYKNGFHSVSNFRSDHVGGAYFLFADGASHFVSEGIVPDVYRSLSSIAGSESVDYIN